jgi:hypothetical protein
MAWPLAALLLTAVAAPTAAGADGQATCKFINDTDLSVPGQPPSGPAPSAAACCALCQGKAPFFVWAEATSKCYCKAPPFDRQAAPGNIAGSCGSLPMPPPGPPHNACPAGQEPCEARDGCCWVGPNSYACQPGQNRSLGLPFCDTSKTFAERADDLVGRLTLPEKLALLHSKPGTDGCAFEDSGVPRLDIPIYAWTEESNTGADSSCLGPERCVTTFPSPVRKRLYLMPVLSLSWYIDLSFI